MTRKTLTAMLAWACILPWGCSPATPEPAGKFAAPHGGVLYEFPSKKGSVEITVEPAKDAASGSKMNTHQIAAYFFEIDGKTPLSSAPTDVKVALGDPAPITLKPPDSADKSGPFVSPPGPYAGEIRGTLTASIGGEPVEVAFARR